jgi:ubiquinone/menaquinone biosynthesis C-methylase UbiE
MNQDQHKHSIVAQFTKQAIPFSQMPGHAHALNLMIAIAGATKDDTVLDVACGPGLVACAFAGKVSQVTGVDLTPAMIERARELQEEKGLKNLRWLVHDVTSLPFADKSFSLVLTRYSFHHFLDPKGVLAEMRRVCRTGGTIMVVDVALPPDKRDAYNAVEKLRDPSHTSALTPDELLQLANRLNLKDIRTRWYKVEMELEAQIRASFPNPGDDEKIRQAFRADLGKDHLGVAAHRVGNEIHFAYPVLILAGKKLA